jgi:CrcB protein
MRDLLLVGAGGFVGSVLRWLAARAVTAGTADSRLPLGTLAVNVIGCLAIGALFGAANERDWLTPELRLLLVTGLLGGFTTYSAFAYETHALGREHGIPLAVVNAAIQLALGALATWLGWRLGGAVPR